MKQTNLTHHGMISKEFDIFYYELLRVKEIALKSGITVSSEDDPKTIVVSGPVLALQERLSTFFDSQKERLNKHLVGFNAAFIQDAQYICITLADEVMINCNWQGADYWRQNCLETKFFQTQIGGERIFSLIDNVLKSNDPTQRELARLYHLSLSLGFRGKLLSDDNSKILIYKQQLFNFIYHRSASLITEGRSQMIEDSLENLFTKSPGKGLPDLRSWLMTAGGVLIVYLFISYSIWMIISADLSEVLQGIFELAKQGPVV